MITFAVSEEKNRWLQKKMEELGISENDILEQFIRSSGKGGQHVNKTSTCVYLRHKATGIEIKCMEDRSQSVNRFLARRQLAEAIEQLSGKPTAKDTERERIRKQKSKSRKRSLTKYRSV
ncbi:MAG: peptide chain release factor-like protein [Dissulfurispiraceae bacterium]|jgi:protein subunit release factor B